MAGYGNTSPDDGPSPPGTFGIGWGETLAAAWNSNKKHLGEVGEKIQSIYSVASGFPEMVAELKEPILGLVPEGWGKTVLGLFNRSPQSSDADIMKAIMMAESRGDPLAYNAGKEAPPDDFLSWPRQTEDSLGLYQTNWDYWGNKKPNKWGNVPYNIINNSTKDILGRNLKREDLFNPEVNTAAAHAIADSEGFKPWSTYTSGAYKEFL